MRTGLEPQLLEIPAGGFLMGSERGLPDERPVHRVRVGRFWIAPGPVTNREYGRFLAATGHRPPPTWTDPRFCDPDQPVVSVSWFDAVAYLQWLSAHTGRGFRLPTEAEREKAARGGRPGRYPWGDGLPTWLAPVAGPGPGRPDLVGADPANGYGLHNTADLVHEWCSDWYRPDYYAVSPGRDPSGPATGHRRVSRGGSWRHRVPVTRCAARSSIPPDRTYDDYGFRVALS